MDRRFNYSISPGFFDEPAIKLLEGLEGGDRYVLLYLKLLFSCDSANGEMRYSPVEVCEAVGEADIGFVADAFGIFEMFGLIEFNRNLGFRLTAYGGGLCRIEKGEIGRNTPEYRFWRKMVMERDGYRCRMCGATGVALDAHHIEPWASCIEKRFDVSNGVALCRGCHKKKHMRRG